MSDVATAGWLFPKIAVGFVQPVLAGRRPGVDLFDVADHEGLVGKVGGYDDDVARTEIHGLVLFLSKPKTHFSGNDLRELFVVVEVQGDGEAVFEFDPRGHYFFTGDDLAGHEIIYCLDGNGIPIQFGDHGW